ncbi:MAG: hypothetical protein ACTSQQ_09245, partial [Candidatus Helarchaeota archaeon]
GGRIAVGLFDATGSHVDWVQASSFTGSRPLDIIWGQDTPLTINNDNYVYRHSDEDTNNASDWTASTSGSISLLNSGQIGQRNQTLFTILLEPLNNATLFSGNLQFRWISLELIFGNVNYTLQVSNSSSFSYLNYEIAEILETTTTSNTTIKFNSSSGLYFWRIRPTFKGFTGFWSESSNFTIIRNEFAPQLLNAKIFPWDGTQHTEFNFSVVYQDVDDNPPVFINISINESIFLLEKYNSSDNTYSDGCLFQFTSPLTPGLYSFTFNCFDGKYYTSSGPFNGLNVTELNLYSPLLTNGLVNNALGYDNLTPFLFMVNYTDLDNMPPDLITITINTTTYPMEPQNENDTNYMDGCIFVYSTLLEIGSYTYSFNCSDGKNKVYLGPFDGPTVERPIPWNLLPLSGIRLGAVITHFEDNPRTKYANYPYVSLKLIQRGVNFTDITSIITPELLSNYDMIWIDEHGAEMNITEVEAIEEWIRQGGRILISGEDMWSASKLVEYLNFSYYDHSATDGYTNAISFHPITAGVNEVRMYAPYKALNISGQPKVDICVELEGNPSVVAMTLGKGRIVILCDEIVLYDTKSADNHLFINNTFGWLGFRSEYSPELINGTVNPPFGNQTTQFNFTVIYMDRDNNSPFSITVWINGIAHTMTKQDLFDIDYTDGCLYQYSTLLSLGLYNYSFQCNDGIFQNQTDYKELLVSQEIIVINYWLISGILLLVSVIVVLRIKLHQLKKRKGIYIVCKIPSSPSE